MDEDCGGVQFCHLILGEFGAEVCLSVIGISVDVQVEMADNLSKIEDLNDEEE